MDDTINGYYNPYTGDYDPRLPQCRSMKCKIAIVGGVVVIVTVLGYGSAQASSKAPKSAALRLRPH